MQGGKKVPVRTCIACRTERPKRELFRIVKGADGILLDPTGKAAGRGAYVCPSEECMKKVMQKKLLARTFSEPVATEIYVRLQEEMARLLGSAQTEK